MHKMRMNTVSPLTKIVDPSLGVQSEDLDICPDQKLWHALLSPAFYESGDINYTRHCLTQKRESFLLRL